MTTHAYVSLLTSDSYLPGALVLHHSLRATGTRLPYVLLITPAISPGTREVLARHGIAWRLIERPVTVASGVSSQPRWDATYAKIHVFDQVDLDKVVFLDGDMLVTRSLDHLFDRPHMSAVNSGGLLPEHASWTMLNSGLLVVEPSRDLFEALLRRIAELRVGEGGGDQALLHAQFPDWPRRPELHLDHRYNLFHTHLDRYHRRFGWTLDEVAVIHFIGETKPWDAPAPVVRWPRAIAAVRRWGRIARGRPSPPERALQQEAVRRWWRCHAEAMRAAPVPAGADGKRRPLSV